MIRIYNGSGSREIQLLGSHYSDEEWFKTRQTVSTLLTARKKPGAKLLDELPWELRDGTNVFGDDFCVLYARLPVDRYVEVAAYEHDDAARKAAQAIVASFDEVGVYVRFVAFEPETASFPVPVAAPIIKADAASTTRALEDAERLIQTNGAISAVDRVHTALHGYLREVCVGAGISFGQVDSSTALWRRIRTEHPAFSNASKHGEHISRIVMSIGTILDALHPVRNNASVAHANEELLNEAEAMLAVNAARTILHYVNATVRSPNEA